MQTKTAKQARQGIEDRIKERLNLPYRSHN